MTSMSEIAAAQRLSGCQYPAAAVTAVETYWWHLAALRRAAARAEAAAHLQALATAAGQIAAALTGTAGAAMDTALDPLAWTDTATYLTRLAIALHGGLGKSGERWETSDGDGTEWEDLAAAASRREFATAWHPIRANLIARAALSDSTSNDPEHGPGSGPELRTFTAAQVIRAAATLMDAPW